MRRSMRLLLAGVVALGGVLIAVGSQWRLTSTYVPSGARFTGGGTMLTAQLAGSRGPLNLSEWLPLSLLLCGIVLASIGFDAGSDARRRVAAWWTFLIVAGAATACAAVVGVAIMDSTDAAGAGYFLVVAGCVLGLAGSGLWCWSARVRERGRLPASQPATVAASTTA